MQGPNSRTQHQGIRDAEVSGNTKPGKGNRNKRGRLTHRGRDGKMKGPKKLCEDDRERHEIRL